MGRRSRWGQYSVSFAFLDLADEIIRKYNEHNPAFPPPPIALPPADDSLSNTNGETLGMDEMAAILDSGFDDDPQSQSTYAPLSHPRSRAHQPPPSLFRTLANAPSPVHRHQHEYTAPQPRINLTDSPNFSSSPNSIHSSPHSAGASGYTGGQYVSIDGQDKNDINAQMPHSGGSVSSSVESRPYGVGHAKKRSGGGPGPGAGLGVRSGGYGPLGPLADVDEAGKGQLRGHGGTGKNR